jgi:pSer/pThr/pTyr-binding forkhead associated (FHA) protein
MNSLGNLEARLQSIVEDFLVKIVPGGKTKDQVSQKLATLMQTHIRSQVEDNNLAPNVFEIVVHPSQAGRWHQQPGFMDDLAHALETAGMEANLRFSGKVKISIAMDDSMAEGDVQVLASFSPGSISETQGMQPGFETQEPDRANPDKAFLIINGKETIQIDQPMINLGRRFDNHAVIDDLRVSRNHAQIRAIKGNYLIFDLNSSGGTFVNGIRINQSILNPGDVISLAGVTLIFGQDRPETGQEDPATRISAFKSQDHPTEVHEEDEKPAE